ncbi:MAG: energy-coupling factor transporter transmembrane component T [Lachnospiraceae bacterium]|nr:energy-coupling factor transporter transmembrane component T [Lachnospiraceae bacterium]
MTEHLLKAIAGIIDSDTISEKKPSQVSPFLRLAVAVFTIILCACSGNAVFVITVLTVELLRLAFLPAERMTHVLKRLALPVIFTMLIMLPAVFLGHQSTMLTVTLKVAESVLILLLMNERLSWKEVTGVFSEIHLPSVITMTLDTTVRFLVMLGRLASRIHEAYLLRSFGHRNDRRRMSAAGGILGTVFLKSSRLSQESFEAMLCRGFNGTYRRVDGHKFSVWDTGYLVLVPVLVIFFIITQRAL